jgi:signal transduction histidine kinase
VTLRTRLALTATLVMVPTVAALYCLDAIARHRAAEQLLTEIVSARLPMERERCESSPESWGGLLPGGPRPPPPAGGPPPGVRRRARPAVVFAYDDHLRSPNPAAPPVPDALRRALLGHEIAIEPFAWRSSEVELLLRTSWGTGPCAFVLAQGTTGEWGAVVPETQIWLLPIFVVFATVLLAMGPVVRRIRQLTEAVQLSASTSYEHSVAIPGRDEIGALARAFDVAGREVRTQLHEREQREKDLRDFVANTTHDVMIPLTVLQGHLMTLREGVAANERVDAGIVSSAMDEAHYMASLMHNLAAAARLQAGEAKLQRSKVEMGTLIARVVGRHRPISRERGVSLESACPEQPVHAFADITLLEQAISNITYNAVRYNRAGGHVAVILEAGSSDRFCVRVVDDGPGIPADLLAKIAERGVRGDDARTRVPEGQGLGLDIAYRAARLHGFRLTLRPSEYGGLEARLEGERLPREHRSASP